MNRSVTIGVLRTTFAQFEYAERTIVYDGRRPPKLCRIGRTHPPRWRQANSGCYREELIRHGTIDQAALGKKSRNHSIFPSEEAPLAPRDGGALFFTVGAISFSANKVRRPSAVSAVTRRRWVQSGVINRCTQRFSPDYSPS